MCCAFNATRSFGRRADVSIPLLVDRALCNICMQSQSVKASAAPEHYTPSASRFKLNCPFSFRPPTINEHVRNAERIDSQMSSVINVLRPLKALILIIPDNRTRFFNIQFNCLLHRTASRHHVAKCQVLQFHTHLPTEASVTPQDDGMRHKIDRGEESTLHSAL